MKFGICKICRSESVTTLLDFGQQALCNRFLSSPTQHEPDFPLSLGQCHHCGLVQLEKVISPADLRPRFDWITYNEQEGHLDHMVEGICQLPGMTTESNVGAVGFKDDSTVERFRKRGFGSTWRIDAAADLGIAEANAGLETVQAYLTPERAKEIAVKHGKANLLIVRHILEHAHEPHQFAVALRELVQPKGYIVFEVPDCAPALGRGDYTMPWEEHIVYYTPETFQQSLALLGFSLVHYHCYPYANENSLIAIVQPEKTASIPIKPDISVAQVYAHAFPECRELAAKALQSHKNTKGKIAIFGAGHLSCAWVNFLKLESYIEFFVDDHPKKKGMFMPGSRLPIRGSSSLIEEDISLCLLSLSPESETKVVAKNQSFVERGGIFCSIFPGKPNSLQLLK